MPTLEEVREQIGHQPSGARFLGRKEIKELPKILWDDEMIEQLVQGTYNVGTGVLVATNKRLIFVDKGIGKLRVEDFPYDKISSIQYETGWMSGTITIFASGNKAEIKNVVKDSCKGFADYVRARISPVSESVQTKAAPTAGTDLVDQLERLGKLKDQGILTEEEFTAQKTKILGS
jgi:hypothetical protein